MKSLAAFLLSIVFVGLSYGQGARMVFHGAYLNIENGAQLVIDNSNPNAISRMVQGGHIISEHENDVVRWNLWRIRSSIITSLLNSSS